MNEWNATEYGAKDNLLRVVQTEADSLFEMARADGAWERQTACPLWQVRDIVGHLIDVTESYFVGFDAAHSGAAVAAPLGLRGMADRLDAGARAHRDLTQDEALERLNADFDKLMETCRALGPDEWGGTQVPHKYMGPLPAFFYPVFQLIDYGVHGWDIRQGTGQAHGLAADTADLLVPFMFIVWQATTSVPSTFEPVSVGIRVSGRNAGDYAVTVTPDGLTYALGDIGDLPAVVSFDPGSLVLTAYGRMNAGTISGDREVAHAFLNSFFRI